MPLWPFARTLILRANSIRVLSGHNGSPIPYHRQTTQETTFHDFLVLGAILRGINYSVIIFKPLHIAEGKSETKKQAISLLKQKSGKSNEIESSFIYFICNV